jgi:homoserine dehydrogenase
VRLRYSAAVGGSMPALETLARLVAGGREIRSLSGVLNGTSNFVLDRWCSGENLDDAVREAQRLGFAEADPTLDLDGSDAAQKLVLLAHAAFGVEIAWQEIPRLGLDRLATLAIDPGARRERRVRLVARCDRVAGRVVAQVRLSEVPANHLFARVHGTDNALVVELAGGETVEVFGRGAGRWPTGEAVLADLFDLVAARQASLSDEALALEEAQ